MVANNLIYTYDFSNNSWSKFMQLPMQQIHKYSCATRISKDGQIVVDIISTLWAKKVTGPHIWTQWTEPVDQITHWTIDVETRQFTKYVLDVLQFGNLVIDNQNYDSNFLFSVFKVLYQFMEESCIIFFPETRILFLAIT